MRSPRDAAQPGAVACLRLAGARMLIASGWVLTTAVVAGVTRSPQKK
ncbi:hypothetical protein ABZZ80_20515 [Streptomyces sp. NPDC006356]